MKYSYGSVKRTNLTLFIGGRVVTTEERNLGDATSASTK